MRNGGQEFRPSYHWLQSLWAKSEQPTAKCGDDRAVPPASTPHPPSLEHVCMFVPHCTDCMPSGAPRLPGALRGGRWHPEECQGGGVPAFNPTQGTGPTRGCSGQDACVGPFRWPPVGPKMMQGRGPGGGPGAKRAGREGASAMETQAGCRHQSDLWGVGAHRTGGPKLAPYLIPGELGPSANASSLSLCDGEDAPPSHMGSVSLLWNRAHGMAVWMGQVERRWWSRVTTHSPPASSDPAKQPGTGVSGSPRPPS